MRWTLNKKGNSWREILGDIPDVRWPTVEMYTDPKTQEIRMLIKLPLQANCPVSTTHLLALLKEALSKALDKMAEKYVRENYDKLCQDLYEQFGQLVIQNGLEEGLTKAIRGQSIKDKLAKKIENHLAKNIDEVVAKIDPAKVMKEVERAMAEIAAKKLTSDEDWG